jgi:hypothetical protein
LKLGFQREKSGEVALVQLRRGSVRFWTTAKVRRPSERRDGLGSVNSALDCFQKKEMRTAGGVRCAGELRELVYGEVL